MNEPCIFESSSTDSSFPWNVFIATTALYLITYNLWAILGNKGTHVLIWINALGWIPGYILAKFIQKLKATGTKPPITVSKEGLYLQHALGRKSFIPWTRIKNISTSIWKDQNQKSHPALLIEAFSDKAIHKVKKHYVIEDLIADGLDALVQCIEHHHPVTKNI